MAAAFGKFSDDDGEGPPPAATGSTSIVGRGTELSGDLTGSGQLRVEGRVDGTIRLDGEVQIASEGAVEGRIEADEVVAAGRVSGTIAARNAVRLEEGCQVDADVYCPVLQLEEGGRINGRVDMSGDAVSDALDRPASTPPRARASAPDDDASPGDAGGPPPEGEQDGDDEGEDGVPEGTPAS